LDYFWRLGTTFGRLWASFAVNLGALGATWLPWAPILVSEINLDWFLVENYKKQMSGAVAFLENGSQK